MKLLLDMSSVMWTSLSAGTDVDGIVVVQDDKKIVVPTCAYGYENAVNMIVAALREQGLQPRDMIMVFEGKDSKSRRCMIDPTYKAGRGKRVPEAYEQFNLLKDKLKTTFRNLGAMSATQDFVEGDDILAYIANNLSEDCIVMTNDNDLCVLQGVNPRGGRVHTRIGGAMDTNKYGMFDVKLVTLYKSLVGDSSDNIRGCPGFGPKAWDEFLLKYDEDGCHELMNLIRDGKRNAVAAFAEQNKCKYLAKIVDKWDEVVKSFKLASLHPEWGNTVRLPLILDGGLTLANCNDERLKRYAGEVTLVTASNYAEALDKLVCYRGNRVSLDIETSTPDESTDWIAENGIGVDVHGSFLTGFSITFGPNNRFAYYVSVDHAYTNNVTMAQARKMIEALIGAKIYIQNTAFELCVFWANCKDEDGTSWRQHWEQYGEFGMLPGVEDTKLLASYVDENSSTGLKQRSFKHLGYVQGTYDETTLLDEPKFANGVPEGGKWRYKMRDLPAVHVLGYGADDTITTAGLADFYETVCDIENTLHVYQQVERDAAYQHAKNFCDGVSISMETLRALEKEDDQTYEQAWSTIHACLMKAGWQGTVPPSYDSSITCKQMKEAYAIVSGIDSSEPDEDDAEEGAEAVQEVKDPVMSSRVRTPAKLAILIAQEQPELGVMLDSLLAGNDDGTALTAYVRRYFKLEPVFKASNRQMSKLLYEVLALPIRVRNKVTKTMKLKGILEGSPKADALALAYAMRDAAQDAEKLAVLKAIQLYRMIRTRRSLYYSKYPYMMHWRDGKVHSSHNQCATNTRRASSSGPNLQQLPKHPKIEGQESKFRSVIVPHKRNAVVVSMDFVAQELRVIADYSQDPNMLACYVGDNLKDMHTLTGAGIMAKEEPVVMAKLIAALPTVFADRIEAQYQAFMALSDGSDEQKKLYKHYRALGKKVGFTTEYGAAAPKLAATMLIEEDTAQDYIDARESAFSRAKEWKGEVQEEAREFGFVKTKLGARRHLAAALNSEDRYISSKADRQAVNFKIQSSSAEMTKLAECRMWRAGLFVDYDAVCYGSIHDEIVASVLVEDLLEFLPKMHACMVQPYADMRVPIKSSISFGPNFYRQIEIGEEADPEAIKKALQELP